jgi:palmitoyl-protein thioesterase
MGTGNTRTMTIRRMLLACTLALAFVAGASSASTADDNSSNENSLCQEKEWREHPVLCHFLERARDDLDALAAELHQSAKAHGWLVDVYGSSNDSNDESRPDIETGTTSVERQRRLRTRSNSSGNADTAGSAAGIPVVLAHGMGDSCFNSGMQRITEKVSELLGGVYTVCIPTGSTQSEDTKNGYFLNMDKSVDFFSEGIAADSNLQQGFHAIGFSQGNNVIRGYIAKVNSPAVHTFISVNGVNAGIGAVPYCQPDLLVPFMLPTNVTVTGSRTPTAEDSAGASNPSALPAVQGVQFSMCDLLMEQASKSAYTEFSQEHSFQANYWRDPRPSAEKDYQTYCQLAVWNNEQEAAGGSVNQTLKENWNKTQGFVWVLATGDGMIWPREGEQWYVVVAFVPCVCCIVDVCIYSTLVHKKRQSRVLYVECVDP